MSIQQGSEPPNTEQQPSAPATPPATSQEERQWRMFSHLAALAGIIVPLGNILGPLLVWLMKKEQFPVVDVEGKSSLNFQCSMTIYALVSSVLVFVGIGFLLLPVVAVVDLIYVILAASKVNNGESFRYPLSITFFK